MFDDWLKRLGEVTGSNDLLVALEAFRAKVPDAKTLRDVAIHATEYVQGAGQLQHPQGTTKKKRLKAAKEDAAEAFLVQFVGREETDIVLYLYGKNLRTKVASDAAAAGFQAACDALAD